MHGAIADGRRAGAGPGAPAGRAGTPGGEAGAEGSGAVVASSTLTVSCDDCVLDGTAACEDCVVAYLLDRRRDDAVVIDAAEARALRLFEGAGLLPGLRHERRAG